MQQDYTIPTLTSDFNEGKFQIIRLHESWLNCKKYVRAGRLIDWNWELDNIYSELTRDAELKPEHNFDKKIKQINSFIAIHKLERDKMYAILRTKEKILRRLQDISGKGAKRSDSDDDDIDG